MGRLIDDLLAFSRAGRQPLSQGPVDMGALARAAFEALAEEEPIEGVELRIARLAPARGDPALLTQVWRNLIGNALKFTSRKARRVIDVGCVTGAAQVEYFVRDNGVGFDMRYADKLFGVFQRLHSAHEFEGTGVGLALVQRIVARHGGTVSAEGRVGEGATIRFSLPRKGGEA
jgi:light-regulated signal transduction histidine kinase (bacteriophytochrome)